MNVSVIIPCYNADDTIASQLEALSGQDFNQPWELIIADNGSTDGTRAIIEQFMDRIPSLRIIDASQKRGASHARNAGVHAAQGDYLLFCDADDVVSPSWITALVAGLEEKEIAIGICDYRKLNSWVSKLYGQYSLDNTAEVEITRSKYAPYLYRTSGWGFGVRRSTYASVNGFDEQMIAAEDLDFGYRAQIAGASVHIARGAIVHYRLRHTPHDIFWQHRRYGIYTVALYKRYTRENLNKGVLKAWASFIRACLGVLVWHIKTRDENERMLIARNSGFYLGLFQGCMKHRVAPFMVHQ